MRLVPVLFAAALSLHFAAPAATQEAGAPAASVQQPGTDDATAPTAVSSPDREALRQRLEDLKARRAEAVARLSEARKAFDSSQVELKIKVSHLRAARVENNREKAAALEKEVVQLREEVRVRRQAMLDALKDTKRLRAETRAAAVALGRAGSDKS